MTAAGDAGRVAALLAGASFEIPPRDGRALAALADAVPAGAEVFIAFPPNWSHHDVVETARAVRDAGRVPVPHLAARNLASRTQLDQFLARIAGEAGVDHVLAIAGDARRPSGPFGATLDVIETGALERAGIRRVSVAAHPEGNPHVAGPVLRAALEAKLAALSRRGLAASIVTQFCFEAPPILALVDELRSAAPAVPVRVGIAGPANVATLLRFAVRCGVGNSLRALRTRADSIARLLGEDTPEALVAALAPAVGALHIFSFGGLAATRAWIDRRR